MAVAIVFLAALMAIAAWWLSQQKLSAKPWLEEGVIGDFDGTGAMSFPAAKIGMGLFLAVVGSLFALLTSAYFMRMGYPDWRSIRIPQLLWVNTGALILASVALQAAQGCVRRRDLDSVRVLLLVAGVFGVAFLAGQLWAWRELTASGFLLADNPSNSFFYLITGLHGLHMVGGALALGWTADQAWRGDGAFPGKADAGLRREIAAEQKASSADKLRLAVEMCTMYWHFLLIVWLILFAMMTGLADDLGVICRQLLT
jgi:cytochrome c oxidase subunit 3